MDKKSTQTHIHTSCSCYCLAAFPILCCREVLNTQSQYTCTLFFFFPFLRTHENETTVLHCVFSAFSTTGFERHTSLVFNPADPESSVEDCLAAVGDRVARELDAKLAAAVDALLTGSASLFRARGYASFFWKLCQKKKKVCVHSIIFIQHEKRPQTQSYNLGMRKVSVDIEPLASFLSLWGEQSRFCFS